MRVVYTVRVFTTVFIVFTYEGVYTVFTTVFTYEGVYVVFRVRQPFKVRNQ